jgi:hypothetical protein
MKMMTKEIESRFQKLGRQDHSEAVVVAKFFCPWNGWTWYATEFDAENREFFGLVVGHESELGSFSLDELEAVRGPMGLRIERDLHWVETPMSAVRQIAASTL